MADSILLVVEARLHATQFLEDKPFHSTGLKGIKVFLKIIRQIEAVKHPDDDVLWI